MSREQIENRIRGLFLFLFGIIFVFLFILTSSYLKVNENASSSQEAQVRKFLLDGISMREKFIFEEFMTRNYGALASRIQSFLEDFNIKDHALVVVDDNDCTFGDQSNCNTIIQLNKANKNENTSIFSNESLGKFFVLFPMIAWGKRVGVVAVIIPSGELSIQRTFLEQLFFYVLPFLLLILMTLFIYKIVEKNLIKPTIDRIIEVEKFEAQRMLARQFAHDIQSPINAIEVALEHTKNLPEESSELLSVALSRITSLSKDLLSRDTSHVPEDKISIYDIVQQAISDKKLEYNMSDASLSLFLSDELKYIHSFDQSLYRVLSNLINNSIEACTMREKMNIQVSFNVKNSSLNASIEDNGIGIEKNLIPLILKGDYSTKDYGLGLGLSGARRWIEDNNGVIEVSSIREVGTKIFFMIPVYNGVLGSKC